MLPKLIRYEFKALARVLPTIYLGLVVLAVAAGISFHSDKSLLNGIFASILLIAVTALFFINLVFVIVRFRDNLLNDEGYLMLTLPVRPWEHIAAKAIGALCSFLASGIVLVMATLIAGLIIDFPLVQTGFRDFFPSLLAKIELPMVISGITVLVFAFQQLCVIYAALLVSRSVPRFRGIFGFGLYFAVSFLVESPLTKSLHSLQGTFSEVARQLIMLIAQAALAALFFWIATWLLKRRCNLE
jgi:hypothetical protein